MIDNRTAPSSPSKEERRRKRWASVDEIEVVIVRRGEQNPTIAAAEKARAR